MIVQGLSEDDARTLDRLLTQLKQKQRRNMLRAAAYDGKRAARDLGISMPPVMRSLSYVLEWPSIPCDALNLRCFLEDVTSTTDTIENLGLDVILDENRFWSESQQGQLSSLIHATGFLVTTRGEKSKGEPEVVFTFRDALNATGLWNDRQRRLVAFLSVTERGTNGDPVAGILYLPGKTYHLTKAPGHWLAEGQDSTLDYVPVEPLVYKPRIGRPFGSSRITRPMLSLLDQAMRTLGRSESQAEIFSLPQRYAMGADSSMFVDAAGNPIDRWKILLGGVWWAEANDNGDAPTVGQFPQASQQPHLDHLRTIGAQFAAAARMSPHDFGISASDVQPTAEGAMETASRPLIDLADGATREWGYAYARSMKTACRLLGTYRDGLNIGTKWRDIRYTSRAAAADAGQKILTQVPWLAETAVGLELLGLSADQIERALAERARQAQQSDMALLSRAIERQGE